MGNSKTRTCSFNVSKSYLLMSSDHSEDWLHTSMLSPTVCLLPASARSLPTHWVPVVSALPDPGVKVAPKGFVGSSNIGTIGEGYHFLLKKTHFSMKTRKPWCKPGKNQVAHVGDAVCLPSPPHLETHQPCSSQRKSSWSQSLPIAWSGLWSLHAHKWLWFCDVCLDTLPKTNIAPQNGCLGDYFHFGKG